MAKVGPNMSRYVHVRVTPEEDRLVKFNAALLGTSVSEYVRTLLQIPITIEEDGSAHIQDGSTRFLVYDQTTYKKLHTQIRAYGYHYNQAIYALNIIKSKRFIAEGDALELFNRAIDILEDIENTKDGMLTTLEELLGQSQTFIRSKTSNDDKR